jgi:hypothetical protein
VPLVLPASKQLPGISPDILSLLDARQEQVPGYAYKLTGQSLYASDVPLGNTLDIDEKSMSLWLPIADGNRRDGVGDLLEVEGIVTERHYSNPVCLFDHAKSVLLPIARARSDPEDPSTYTFRVDPVARTAGFRAHFYQGRSGEGGSFADKGRQFEHALFCEQLFDMARQGFLRSGSIGYQVLDAEHLPPDYRTGVPQGLHLKSILMLEGSLVVLPANQDTVAKMLALPTICGKPPSPYLIKSLSPYAPPKKAVVTSGYERKSADPLSELKKVCESFRGIEGLGPDYQRAFWHPERKEVWWESFDGDEKNSVREVKSRLEKIPGITKVTVESEASPPHGEGWLLVYSPNKEGLPKEWKSLEPVPLDDVRDGPKVPPAEWKPGAGAVKSQIPGDLNFWQEEQQEAEHRKALRRKYRKKALPEGPYRSKWSSGEWYLVTDIRNGQPVCIVVQEGQQRDTGHVFPSKREALDWLRDNGYSKSLPGSGRKAHTYGVSRDTVGGRDRWWVYSVNSPGSGQGPYASEEEAQKEADQRNAKVDEERSRKGKQKNLHHIKALRVRYRSKVVKGFADVQLKFDVSHLGLAQQNAFAKVMAEAGYGRPSGPGTKFLGEGTELQKPVRVLVFGFGVEPTGNVTESVREALEVANAHGARFLGNSGKKSLETQGAKNLMIIETSDGVNGVEKATGKKVRFSDTSYRWYYVGSSGASTTNYVQGKIMVRETSKAPGQVTKTLHQVGGWDILKDLQGSDAYKVIQLKPITCPFCKESGKPYKQGDFIACSHCGLILAEKIGSSGTNPVRKKAIDQGQLDKLVRMASRQQGDWAVQIRDGSGQWRTIGWYGNEAMAESQREKASATFDTEDTRVAGPRKSLPRRKVMSGTKGLWNVRTSKNHEYSFIEAPSAEAAKKEVEQRLQKYGRTGETIVSVEEAPPFTSEPGRHLPDKKSKGKSMKTKQLPEETPPTPEPELAGEGAVEPYGAQVLRRIHQDAGILLQEYDEMMEHLEDEAVRQHVQEELEELEARMTKIEQLFSGHERYKDLPPLEGAMDEEEAPLNEETKGVGEEEEPEPEEVGEEEEGTVPADSEEDELPPAEEAVEGMRTKSLRLKHRKAQPSDDISPAKARQMLKDGTAHGHKLTEKQRGMLGAAASRGKSLSYKQLGIEGEHEPGKECRKGMCPECGKENCSCGQKALMTKVAAEALGIPEKEFLKIAKEVGAIGKRSHLQGTLWDEREIDKVNAKLRSEGRGKSLDLNEEPGTETTPAPAGLEPHHKAKVGEAAGFLKDLADEHNFHDEHRLKSFHYHKSLDEIADGLLPGGRVKGFPEMDKETGEVGVTGKDFPEAEKEGREVGLTKPSGDSLGIKDFPEVSKEDAAVNVTKPAGDSLGIKDLDPTGGMEGAHPHYGPLKKAAAYLKDLSTTHDFGERHRQEAGEHAKALDEVASSPDEAAPTEEPPVEPGEMGQKDLARNRLQKVLDHQYENLKNLNARIAQLNGLLPQQR